MYWFCAVCFSTALIYISTQRTTAILHAENLLKPHITEDNVQLQSENQNVRHVMYLAQFPLFEVITDIQIIQTSDVYVMNMQLCRSLVKSTNIGYILTITITNSSFRHMEFTTVIFTINF